VVHRRIRGDVRQRSAVGATANDRISNQSMASQKGCEVDTSYVRGFIEEMKSSGFVAKALARYGMRARSGPPAPALARRDHGRAEERHPSLRSRAPRTPRRASRLPHQRAADLAEAESALALPQQYPGHVLRARGEIRIFLRDPNQEVRLKPG